MTLSITSIQSDDLKIPITLYRIVNGIDAVRNIVKPTLEIIGEFKAAIDDMNIAKPEDNITNIYTVKKVFVRVSDFYRQEFIRNNYIRYNGQLMRIVSVNYHRMNGISCCICYDIDEVL